MLSSGSMHTRPATATAFALWVGLVHAGCAHGAGAGTGPGTQLDGVAAIHHLTEALRLLDVTTAAQPDAYRWWIADATLAPLRRRSLPRATLPVGEAPPRDGLAHRMTQRTAFIAAACAAHVFAPLILEQSDRPALRALGEDLTWRDRSSTVLARGAYVRADDFLPHYDLDQARLQALYERLQGARRRRPPSTDELAAGLLLAADAAMTAEMARDMIDPGMYRWPGHQHLVQPPLTYAPLYALSAGADASRVWAATEACLGAMTEAQRNPAMQPSSLPPYWGR